MKLRYLVLAIVLVGMLVASTALSTAGYYGARHANEKTDREREASIQRNCEQGNRTNRGVLDFIAATLNTEPLVAPVTGDVQLDAVIAQIIGQVNTNQSTRNQAIADARRVYFPIRDCTTGKVIPVPST